MLKLLIVDDEYNIREGLARAVDWASAGVEVAGAAGSGAEALELFDRLAPDIVITDIFMEEMNGLELIEAISQRERNTKFILISGYDEFAYARRAIDLKVYRYLLKPILPEDILAVVKPLVEEIAEEQEIRLKIGMFDEEIARNRDILTRQLLHDVLYGHGGSAGEYLHRAALLKLELQDSASVCAVFEADGGAVAESGPYGAARMPALGIHRIAEEIFRRHRGILTYFGDDNRVYVIAPAGARDFDETLAHCVERLQKAARQNLGVTVSAGVGGVCRGLVSVSQSRREAMRALEFKMAAGREAVIFHRDVLAMDGLRFAYPAEEERLILEAVSREDSAEVALACDAFFQVLAGETYDDKRIRAAVAKLYDALALKLGEWNAPAPEQDAMAALAGHDTLEGVRQWFAETALRAVDGLGKARAEGIRSVIHSAEKFIQANYRDMELSLSMVAEHMGLTPSYFSRLFKQETGSSYIDYVINLRIECAKRLLRTTSHRIFDVGEMVGYPNSQYFCTLFRKACGVSPAEYREGRDGT